VKGYRGGESLSLKPLPKGGNMTDSPDDLDPYDKDLLYSIILIDVIYLIGFAEHYPSPAQIEIIQHIRDSEPTLQKSTLINEIIADSLEEKLSNDFTRTANRILLNISRIVDDQNAVDRIFYYAQQVAMAGNKITPNVQNLLNRISDALFL